MTLHKNIRIGVDARTIFSPYPRGIGKSLIDLYGHVAILRPDWSIILIHEFDQSKVPMPIILNHPNIERRGSSIRGHRFNTWEQIALPYRAWRDKISILHCPANTCPVWMSTPTMVTIHDLIPLDGDDQIPLCEVKYFYNCVRRACRKAQIIFTPSDYVRFRLIHQFQVEPKRVVVNEWAANSKICRLDENEYIKTVEEYNIRRPYCLHFGSSTARKNTERTLLAWSKLDQEVRSIWSLLVIGLNESALYRFKSLSRDLGISKEVHLKGFAPENHISALLSGADVLIFASLSEGFGLPILDAWATDTAIIAGNKTSLPEIAGQAAYFVDATSITSIADGLKEVLNNCALRKNLCELGQKRLTNFTWRSTAMRYIKAIENLLPN